MIIGNRVRLRGAEREDIPRFTIWMNDPEVTRHLKTYWPFSHVEEEGWFDSMIKNPIEEHPLVIEVLDNDEWVAIGNIGLVQINWLDRSAMVGIFIGEKQHWGYGYGSEAMSLLVNFGFKTLNLHRIGLHVYETNERAIRSYERAGFVHEGRMREAKFLEGKFVDVLLMGILNKDWQE